MEYKVTQLDNGWTYFDWTLSGGVTAEMIDWHWSNIDKTFLLWHPSDHYGIEWYIPVTKDQFIGAIHYTLQARDGAHDMTMEMVREQGLGLAFLDIAELNGYGLSDLVIYSHCCLVGARKHGKIDPKFNSFRLHQWEDRDGKVVGRTTAVMFDPVELEAEKKRLIGWVKHAAMEIGRFEEFLPQLFTLYLAVKDPNVNPFHDLTVEKDSEGNVKYVNI